MQIPKVANIEVPKIELVQGYKSSLKFFHPPDYYYTHPTLPNNTLENIQGYEINEDDLKMLESIATSKKLPPSLLNQKIFEDAFELWENDTGRGQIIPYDRACYLTKENKICEKWDTYENPSITGNSIIQALYDQWIKQRDKMGRPLLRRYWKSEGINDIQLKIAFQPRGGYREKMRLRNSKKNDYEAYDKVIIT